MSDADLLKVLPERISQHDQMLAEAAETIDSGHGMLVTGNSDQGMYLLIDKRKADADLPVNLLALGLSLGTMIMDLASNEEET